jgi:segregation and condensation protein A
MITNNETKFKLDNFEGPLDLLLHLIRDKKLDILEVSLVEIADQYIAFIEEARKFNLDIAAEYLLIASQLVEMKSKNLMKTEIFTGPPEEYEEDSKELLERLIEYEKYKSVSDTLIGIYEANPQFDKDDDEYVEYMEEEADRAIELMTNGKSDLIDAFYSIQERIREQKPLSTKIVNTRISPEVRRKEVEDILKESGDTTFISLIESSDRYYIAVSLLVVLEMANQGIVKLVQTDSKDDIQIMVVK